jgi:hypothetical protein
MIQMECPKTQAGREGGKKHNNKIGMEILHETKKRTGAEKGQKTKRPSLMRPEDQICPTPRPKIMNASQTKPNLRHA